jgi:hypothetical protein
MLFSRKCKAHAGKPTVQTNPPNHSLGGYMFRHALLFGATVALCTFPLSAQDYFCNAGVHANAFLDWSKLPPPGNSPYSATIPVTGAPGLTVNVDLSMTDPPAGGGPIFSVSGNTYLQVRSGVGVVRLTFSQPVQGIRLLAGAFGRFGHSFDMQVAKVPNATPGDTVFHASSSGTDRPGTGQPTSTPLAAVDNTADIKEVTFTVQNDPFEYFDFSLDNVRIQLGSADKSSLVSSHGLLQWLRADKGVVSDFAPSFGDVLSWTDQSGHGHSAFPNANGAAVGLVPQGGHFCQPAVVFGTGNLKAQLPLSGLPEATMFLVSRANDGEVGGSQHAALFWPGLNPWGRTYLSPSQTQVAFSFGTTQPGNATDVLRAQDIGGDYSLTTAVHDGMTDYLYIDGRLINKEANRQQVLNGATGEELIGAGDGNTYFKGNIAEIIIYDRALSARERDDITYYLSAKYGLYQ